MLSTGLHFASESTGFRFWSLNWVRAFRALCCIFTRLSRRRRGG